MKYSLSNATAALLVVSPVNSVSTATRMLRDNARTAAILDDSALGRAIQLQNIGYCADRTPGIVA